MINLLNEYVVTGSILRVCAINDLNGDGNLEIIVRKMMANEFVVLDCNFNELWNLCFNESVLNVIPTDLNNDGINELIVSTTHSLQVRKWKLGPSFSAKLNDQVACKNDNVTFEVIVEGISPIHYQWQKDGVNIAGANDSILILEQVLPEDGGEYRCIASNDYGIDTSNIATLSIEFAIPTTILGLTNVIEYQVVIYSVAMEEGHIYEFWAEGGNRIDETENTITVHWGAAGQGFVKLLETSELGCIADTNTLNVTIGNLGIDDKEAQNLSIYPNPINKVTTIIYKLNEPSQVSIQLYDNYGQLIDTPLNAYQHNGTYHISWNAEDLPPGIYFMRLQNGNDFITKKIIKF